MPTDYSPIYSALSDVGRAFSVALQGKALRERDAQTVKRRGDTFAEMMRQGNTSDFPMEQGPVAGSPMGGSLRFPSPAGTPLRPGGELPPELLGQAQEFPDLLRQYNEQREGTMPKYDVTGGYLMETPAGGGKPNLTQLEKPLSGTAAINAKLLDQFQAQYGYEKGYQKFKELEASGKLLIEGEKGEQARKTEGVKQSGRLDLAEFNAGARADLQKMRDAGAKERASISAEARKYATDKSGSGKKKFSYPVSEYPGSIGGTMKTTKYEFNPDDADDVQRTIDKIDTRMTTLGSLAVAFGKEKNWWGDSEAPEMWGKLKLALDSGKVAPEDLDSNLKLIGEEYLQLKNLRQGIEDSAGLTPAEEPAGGAPALPPPADIDVKQMRDSLSTVLSQEVLDTFTDQEIEDEYRQMFEEEQAPK